MNRLKLFALLTFAGGFLLGLVFFIPLEAIQARVLSAIARQSRVEITLKSLRLGTGLGLGISRGSLLALRGEDAILNLPSGQMLKCQKLILAPKIITLLWGRFSATVYCQTQRFGIFSAALSGSPFWNPEKLNVSVIAENLSITLFEEFLGVSPLAGEINGEIELIDFKLNGRSLPDARWDLSGNKVLLPAVVSDIFNVPPLQLGNFASKGTLQSLKLRIEAFKFGNPTTMLEGNFSANMTLDPQGMPTGGDLNGKLRTNADFEKAQLKDINLDLAFGIVKGSGAREFRKAFKGGPQAILLSAPLDN